MLNELTPDVIATRFAAIFGNAELGYKGSNTQISFDNKAQYDSFSSSSIGGHRVGYINWYLFRVIESFSKTTKGNIIFYDGSIAAKNVDMTRIVLETVNKNNKPLTVEIDVQNNSDGAPLLYSNVRKQKNFEYLTGDTSVGVVRQNMLIGVSMTGRIWQIDDAPDNGRIHLGFNSGSGWFVPCDQ
jgi:hypothetical protein